MIPGSPGKCKPGAADPRLLAVSLRFALSVRHELAGAVRVNGELGCLVLSVEELSVVGPALVAGVRPLGHVKKRGFLEIGVVLGLEPAGRTTPAREGEPSLA